jgi:DNA-binding CsgD family transcriptional regulator
VSSSPAPLVGRTEEVHALRTLITRARNGTGGALVISGDPGIGKTALLKAATNGLSGVTVIHSDGFEAELSMPFAALQRVGMSLADHVGALPARQRQALAVAWGVEDGPTPDRFLVGLGLLGLFAEAGGTRPVVCVIDDAHWLDSESRDVLAFVARRLQAESTVLLFAARDTPESEKQLAGIPSIRLDGLDVQSAVQLLTATASEAVDPYAATQIATATGGNPLALIDLALDLGLRQLSQVSFDLIPISSQLEAHYLRQVHEMAADVQLWLLLAAAETTGQPILIANTAARLGLSAGCADDAARAGLVTHGDVIAFRHPLVRSAVYAATPGSERRGVHAALAAEADRLGLVDVEAWHAGEATTGTDTAVADRLDAVAQRAAKRGGLVSQARLLARAADLTPPGSDRSARLLRAADAALEAGAAEMARQLLDRLDPDVLDAVQRGGLITTRSALGVFVADPSAVTAAPGDMLRAASAFHGHDAEREQRALLSAFEYALMSELAMEGTTLPDLGRRLDEGSRVLDGPHGTVLEALSAHILLPYHDAVPLMRAAVDMLFALEDADLPAFGFVGFALTTALFDEEAGANYLGRLARIARDAGSLRALDTVLWVRSLFELDRGDPATAGQYVEQVKELRRAIGYAAENVVNVSYLAWTGTPRDQLELIAEAARSMGFAGVHRSGITALSVRDIAQGRYGDAFTHSLPLIEAPFLQATYHQLADHVEAAARGGHATEARQTAQTIALMAQASGTPWIRGLDHRCRALLASDDDAEPHFLRAIELLGAAQVPGDLGRAHLLHGEWLRRMKRRRDARSQLRSAVEIFDRVGMSAFADRARAELVATGQTMAKRELVDGVALSPREAAVARMAAEGSTNAEIGAALFISTNTVDYHLRKVFQKFGISSRRQLAERF